MSDDSDIGFGNNEGSNNDALPNGVLESTLGRQQDYVDHYDPQLLYPIGREAGRRQLSGAPRWFGCDIWTAYELSWLDDAGKPQVAIGEFTFPADCPNIIESKSFKYYLNSFNQSPYSDWEHVRSVMRDDLSRMAGGAVQLALWEPAVYAARRTGAGLTARCLDGLPVSTRHYQPDARLLKTDNSHSECEWVSHLLKTNCPVTGQPDWASIWIGYKGQTIQPESLLAYLVSFRQHRDFHEQCVERIFCDLWQVGELDDLWVYARYTRRGGLDINPFRSATPREVPRVVAPRQ